MGTCPPPVGFETRSCCSTSLAESFNTPSHLTVKFMEFARVLPWPSAGSRWNDSTFTELAYIAEENPSAAKMEAG